jgi:hypothetical protein
MNQPWRWSRMLMTFLVLLIPAVAMAKAYFAPWEEMVGRADHIAVMTIEAPQVVSVKGHHWTYSQKAPAVVERNIKGSLPRNVNLYGGEDFICARVNYSPGRYLVFLRRDEDLLVGANWYLSLNPVEEGEVRWQHYHATSSPLRPFQPLEAAIREIQNYLAKTSPKSDR